MKRSTEGTSSKLAMANSLSGLGFCLLRSEIEERDGCVYGVRRRLLY